MAVFIEPIARMQDVEQTSESRKQVQVEAGGEVRSVCRRRQRRLAVFGFTFT